jgi:hypothetical protein
MAGPLFSINSGAVQGAIWKGEYGLQPSIKKAKRDKTGKFLKDADGKQIYTDFYNKNDLLSLSYVAGALYDWLLKNPDVKNPDAGSDVPDF